MGSHLSRRHFLLTAGAVGAGAALTGGLAASQAVGARLHVERSRAFADAAREYHVPAALLAAIAHAQTRWHDHDGLPSAAEGYGPMHLVDGTALAAKRHDFVGKTDPPQVIDTLGQAADASGLDPQAIRTDATTNIRAAAALLARVQRRSGNRTGRHSDPANWYAAVAETSGLVRAHAQLDLADAVMSTLEHGAAVRLPDGTMAELLARPTSRAGSQRARIASRAAQAKAAKRNANIDAPANLNVEWVPAPYEHYGHGPTDYGNHDLAFRPTHPRISHIVIHDTEGYWNSCLSAVQDPTYVSWQYTVRSQDGLIAQHMHAKDVGWHCGNWYLNTHSLGVEHEGFAANGLSWYTEPLYRHSAALVAYLAKKYDVPLDRAHIVGHDQVPGTTTSTIPGMHWDPGPFWDWEHYFELLGAPLTNGTTTKAPKRGNVVRILPGFDGNLQTVTGCQHAGQTCSGEHNTNFVTLRQGPSHSSPLIDDRGQHPGGHSTTDVADIAARATAGTEFVVAAVRGDWTAIWFLGGVAWFLNPVKAPRARVVSHTLGRVRARPGKPARVYGRCYPELSAYKDRSDYQEVEPLVYSLPPGHMYVVTDRHPATDYYKATRYSTKVKNNHVDIMGKTQYLQISVGHRLGYVLRSEVEDVPVTTKPATPAPTTTTPPAGTAHH